MHVRGTEVEVFLLLMAGPLTPMTSLLESPLICPLICKSTRELLRLCTSIVPLLMGHGGSLSALNRAGAEAVGQSISSFTKPGLMEPNSPIIENKSRPRPALVWKGAGIRISISLPFIVQAGVYVRASEVGVVLFHNLCCLECSAC